MKRNCKSFVTNFSPFSVSTAPRSVLVINSSFSSSFRIAAIVGTGRKSLFARLFVPIVPLRNISLKTLRILSFPSATFAFRAISVRSSSPPLLTLDGSFFTGSNYPFFLILLPLDVP